ncbi:hypothetical protein OS493_010613, partial [Desmophyllum pertusum]
EALGLEWKVIMTQLASLRATLGQNMKKKNHTKSGQGLMGCLPPPGSSLSIFSSWYQ